MAIRFLIKLEFRIVLGFSGGKKTGEPRQKLAQPVCDVLVVYNENIGTPNGSRFEGKFRIMSATATTHLSSSIY